MNSQQIINEINRLPLNEKIYVIELVLKNIRQEAQNNRSLREGAKALLADYQNDKDLTAFTVLDYENFYETR